jgi:hypothetical protein
VRVFRIIVALLPQILLLLDVGGSLDLLGGLNRTDTGLNLLILLFLATPVATAFLLVVEMVRYGLQVKRGIEPRSFAMPGLAIALFLEALAIDVFIASQVRMH